MAKKQQNKSKKVILKSDIQDDVPVLYHVPALLTETIEGLNIQPDGVYVDVTFGGGGHSRAILEKLGENGRLFGFDQDIDAVKNIPDDVRFTFVRSNFRYLKNFLKYHGITQINGLLADLGVSSHHFDEAERGFSFRLDGPLDMRMNTASRSESFVMMRYGAVGKSLPCQICLVLTLSIPIAEPCTPVPVYGRFNHSNTPWI